MTGRKSLMTTKAHGWKQNGRKSRRRFRSRLLFGYRVAIIGKEVRDSDVLALLKVLRRGDTWIPTQLRDRTLLIDGERREVTVWVTGPEPEWQRPRSRR